MTEVEAKTKWCPFARAVRGDGVSGFNRDIDLGPDVSAHCLASACMAWRWTRTPEVAKFQQSTDAEYRRVGAAHGAFIHDGPADGHCGLAGKP